MADHFIPLVKVLKSKARIEWKDIIAWYGDHYLILTKDNEQAHRYVKAIAEILTNYISDLTVIDQYTGQVRPLVRVKDMVARLSPENAWKVKFYDIHSDVNGDDVMNNYSYRVIAECCSLLMLTIPASVWGEDYHKE